MKIFRHKHAGFGLIEIMVTLGVLSVGILGVTTLHGVIARQSADNKSRSEALSIAQSRLEEMRNYTNAATSVATFNSLYANTSGFGNTTTVSGVSNDYTRSENISTSGSVKNVIVRVGWTDPNGDNQTVNLNTEFGFISPRKVGDAALEAAEEKVASPTGRARLGDGTLSDDEVADADSNGDGTAEIVRGQDRLLAVGSDVVLTLVEACQTEGGTCADFVRIKGRIYIDRDQLPSLAPGAVHVLASDAAFCSRSYIPSGGDEDDRTSLSNDTTTTVNTSANTSGEYAYFDYTCYLGGGWHGNVGLLVSGNTNWDSCVGDPTSDQTYEQPIRASRRVYRGMLYKVDADEVDGKEKVSGTSLVQYYSQGIGDSAELPVPASGDKTHDFILTGAFSASQLANANPCMNLGPMTRTDSNTGGEAGDRFTGMPDDFYCLNDGYEDTVSTLDVIPDGFGVESDDSYGNTCPYNPADPPATLHHISGSVTMTAPDTDANDVLAAGIGAFTSDGPGTCTMGSVSVGSNTYTRSYDCIVYDWSTTVNDVEVLNGWTGYIEVDYDQSSMRCNPKRISFTDRTSDSSGNNFTGCTPGSFIYFSGTVLSAPNNRELSSVTISDSALGGSCSLAVDGLSYTCLTAEFADGVTTWTGTLTFNTDANYVCTGTNTGAKPAIFTYTNHVSGFVTRNINLSQSTSGCTAP